MPGIIFSWGAVGLENNNIAAVYSDLKTWLKINYNILPVHLCYPDPYTIPNTPLCIPPCIIVLLLLMSMVSMLASLTPRPDSTPSL